MKQALVMSDYAISPVFQVEDIGFPVAYPLMWVECHDDVTTDWQYDTVANQPIAPSVKSRFENIMPY